MIPEVVGEREEGKQVFKILNLCQSEVQFSDTGFVPRKQKMVSCLRCGVQALSKCLSCEDLHV